MRTLCHDLSTTTPGTEVVIEGWVHRRRELARITFLVVRDRSGLAQVVLAPGTPVPPEETTVRVTGTATASTQAPGGIEMTGAVVEALTEAAITPPAELWRPSLDVSLPTLLDHAPVLWRHPAQRARWELAAASLRGFRTTLDGLGFTEIATPKFVESATESEADVFAVDYFGRPAYLAQSPQFYKQQLVGVFERVYEVHFADALALVGAPDDEPDLAPEHERALGAWARGRWRSTGRTSSPSRATPWPSDRSTRTRSRTTHAGPTASTCSSAGSSW